MSYGLNDYETQMLRDKSPLGDAFRAGARCEAVAREAATVMHRELIDYVRALAEHHPHWTSSRIAESAARVFQPGDHETRVATAATVELEDMAASDRRCDGCSEPNRCGSDCPDA